jgi:hypothetical protein
MLNRTRWLLLSGVIGLLSAAAGHARCDEPVWTRSSKPFAPVGPVLTVAAQEPEPNPIPRDVAPPEVQPVSLRRYTPAVVDDAPPVRHKHVHAPIGGYLDRFTRWFFYRAAPNQHCCFMRPTQYRPPLYTWYPYAPANLSNRGGCIVVVVQQPAPTVVASTPGNAAFANEKLPAPQMPKNAKKERPFLPGSSTVMADNPDPVAMPPSLIKSSAKAPVMEPPVAGYNPIPLPGYLPSNFVPRN